MCSTRAIGLRSFSGLHVGFLDRAVWSCQAGGVDVEIVLDGLSVSHISDAYQPVNICCLG